MMEVTSMDVPMDDGMKRSQGRRRYKRRGSATKYNLEGYAANMVAQQPHHEPPPQKQQPKTTTKPGLDFDIFQQALQLSDMSLDHNNNNNNNNDVEPPQQQNPAQRRTRRRSSHGSVVPTKQLPTEVVAQPPTPPRRRYARRGSATRYSIENYQISHQQ